jgi:hypothetical protein
MRSIGGSIGAQIAAAILAGNQILAGRYPAESGFTDAFVMSAAAAVIALLATSIIPRPPRRAEAAAAERRQEHGPDRAPVPEPLGSEA